MSPALPAFVFVGAFLWLVAAAFATVLPSKRQKAKTHVKRAAIAMGISFVAFIVIETRAPHPADSPALVPAERTQLEGDDLGLSTGEIARPTPRPADTPQVATVAAAADNADFEQLSSSQEFVWIRSNQRLLTAKLRDPDSAQFANDYVSYTGGAPVVCGTVNAKNGFGGYTGATPYIGMGELIGVFLPDEVDGFRDLWDQFC